MFLLCIAIIILQVISIAVSIYLHNSTTKLYRLDDKIASRLKKLENPSVELQEFLADMVESGCGIIRISPDAIFIRGMRK